MSPGNLLDGLSPYARVGTAVLPFLVVMGARIVWGTSRLMSWLITLSTAWFGIAMLMAPYSAGMRQELLKLTATLGW